MSDENNHGGVKERLTRIETKLDSMCNFKERTEKRIESLEREKWMTRGALAIVVFLSDSKLGGLLKKVFGV